MDNKMEEILKRLEAIETTLHAVLQAVDISKLPQELQEQIRCEKQSKERMEDISLCNEWIEKDKQNIIDLYNNKPLTKNERAEAIAYYCKIGSARWWDIKKNQIHQTKLETQRNKKGEAQRELRREQIIAREKHEERDPEIRKKRENEIATNKLFQ